MITVSLQDLGLNAASLIDRVEAGERLIVSRDGRPVAELRPLDPPGGPRPHGLASGTFAVPDDFDDPLPEDILGGFEGRAPNASAGSQRCCSSRI